MIGGHSSVEIEQLRTRIVEKEEIIVKLEAQMNKQCETMNCDIRDRLFKKVEHLNAEFEKRLTIVREHYETQWRQKSDDFINEIAENKIRINELLEARDALLKKTMTGTDNSNLENTVMLYKQYLVAKDCELDELRAEYKKLSDSNFELKTQLEDAIRSHERVIVEMSYEHGILVKKTQEEGERKLVDLRNSIGDLQAMQDQRDAYADKIIELDKFIETMKCKHCVELKTAHLEIYTLKERLSEKDHELSTKYDKAKELALLHGQNSEYKLSIESLEKKICRLMAENSETVDYYKDQIEIRVNSATAVMKGEICQLKSLLLARQREFEALIVRTEQLELAQTGNDHAIEMSSLHYKQEVT
jgi:hypothetical protein